MRGRGRGGKRNINYFGELNKKGNYIDDLNVTLTKKKCIYDFIENKDFGHQFENIICNKSCIHLNIQSINEKNIYTKEYKYFYGLKLLLINEEAAYINNYIINLLDAGKYKVIPFSNNYSKLKFGKAKFNISYNGSGVFLVDRYYKKKFLKKINEHKKLLEESITSYSDTYEGTFKFSAKEGLLLNLIIYSSKCEIDGLFEVLGDINISEFKAKLLYSNYSDVNIKSNSLLIYETKSGNKKIKLKNQILKRCNFIYNYLELIYDKPIYYFGFYKVDEESKNYKYEFDQGQNPKDSNSEKSDEKLQTNNNSEKEIKLKGNDNLENKVEQSQDNCSEKNKENTKETILKDKYYINEESTSSKEKEDEQNRSTLNKSNFSKVEENEENKKKNKNLLNKNEIINEYWEDLKITDEGKLNSLLDELPAKIKIFELSDSIFGEKLKYNKEELNLLGNIRDDVKIIKIDVNNLKKDVSDIKVDMNDTKKDISDIKIKVNNLKKDVSNIKMDVNNTKKDISDIKIEVNNLKKDVSDIKIDVNNTKKDISDIKIDVNNLKKDVSDIKVDMNKKFKLLFDKLGINEDKD